MLKSLKIENFRGFQSFELQQLGRINLLVGENNSGKTSVLEAVQMFYSRTNLEPLGQLMINRGESIWNEDRKVAPPGRERELDIRHLFHSHEISLDSKFLISGVNDTSQDYLVASIHLHEPRYGEQVNLFNDFSDGNDDIRDLDFSISWKFGGDSEELQFPLSVNGGLPVDYTQRVRRNLKDLKDSLVKTVFITSSSLTPSEMVKLFDQIVLKPEEEIIVHALQTIEPTIARIASIGSERYRQLIRGGFVIRRSDNDQRVPIGSMGDGIWRMLGLSLAAVCTKGGVLLVDEIDTGLHFATMTNMWRMLWDIAKRSDVQIFATTHSRDCWESLAELVESEDIDEGEITIHRIERDKPSSIIFNQREIVIAAERGIEVR